MSRNNPEKGILVSVDNTGDIFNGVCIHMDWNNAMDLGDLNCMLSVVILLGRV